MRRKAEPPNLWLTLPLIQTLAYCSKCRHGSDAEALQVNGGSEERKQWHNTAVPHRGEKRFGCVWASPLSPCACHESQLPRRAG